MFFAALALPAAAQAKEINALAVCGATSCVDVDLAGFGHRDPIAGDSATADGPPPSDFLRIDFTVDGQARAFMVFYEPRSGLVALEGRPGHVEWARLDPRVAPAVKDAAKRVQPFHAPTLTAVRIGAKALADPGRYEALLTVEGRDVLPKTTRDAEVVYLEADVPNPWTEMQLLYYSDDDVLLRNGSFVKLPGPLVAELEGRAGTSLPWIPIGTVFAGAALLLVLFLRTKTGRKPALGSALGPGYSP